VNQLTFYRSSCSSAKNYEEKTISSPFSQKVKRTNNRYNINGGKKETRLRKGNLSNLNII